MSDNGQRMPHTYEQQHYNPHDGGDASIREALKDPVERTKFRQSALADKIERAIIGGDSPEAIEQLIAQHAEQSKQAGIIAAACDEAEEELRHHRNQFQLTEEVRRQLADGLPACDIDGLIANYLSEARVDSLEREGRGVWQNN